MDIFAHFIKRMLKASAPPSLQGKQMTGIDHHSCQSVSDKSRDVVIKISLSWNHDYLWPYILSNIVFVCTYISRIFYFFLITLLSFPIFPID